MGQDKLSVSFLRLLTVVLCLPVLGGCGAKGPETVEVSGAVTLDGNPVDGAIVGFVPAQGTPATATTDASGKFRLKAAVGQNAVTVIKSEVLGQASAAGDDATGGNVQTKALLPIRYSATQGSGLSFDVKPGMGPVDLELKSQ